ncbi:E3 ubiquitin ligase BIG BROTHER-related isoform X1 [Cryptomeria japonica]|uniref:E3 ubiquitin ligase BIG BROTHER-related isoform X1 n=2 Tax=Cryptomeria japonica TaxID=3369 RepID=UPI0025ACE1B5|nr:E3 ubiquitin ligase BIG BROTHER-related isoform X1 [Cryptomeria japonica]
MQGHPQQINSLAAGMPNSERTANASGQLNTNPVARNLRNERSNRARRRRAATGQRRIDQQRWGQYITDEEDDSASALPTVPRSSNRRRTRVNHQNNYAHHLQEDDYYEDEHAFHATRQRDGIYGDFEFEMALSLSLSFEDSTPNSGNPDYSNQSIANMSYEVLVQLENVKCVASVNVVRSMLDITFKGKKSAQGFINEEEKCAICQCEYEQDEHIISLPCTHCFHHSCGSEWLLDYSKLCPICKLDVTDRNSVNV